MAQRTKLADVARLAGVSSATVSRSLNYPNLLKKDTLKRIQDAIVRLGYVPNSAGRALASRRTQTVGLVVPTLDHAIFSRFTQTMQTALAESGYQLLIASHEYNPTLELSGARALIERGVDALVLVGLERSPALDELLTQSGIPMLATWALDRSGKSASVGFDNHAASVLAARHLLALGHREFGVISGFLHHNDRARARVEGVREALGDAGIKLSAASVVEQPFTYAGGRDGLRALAALSPRPTAVLCGNDLLALGALMECQSLGLAVPQEISVVGFDNQELASHFAPGLTTINVPAADLGRVAAGTILQLLAGDVVQAPVELPIELVVRGSTGPPPTPGRP
ncbi:MAG: LacI family transcriptional regulator [Herminiimonas sp.]|nr:LacI family transcriptional regulator [Herminiimonas sp.]